MTKIWAVVLIFLLVTVIYLNRAYANFYYTIGEKHLASPYRNQAVTFGPWGEGAETTYVSLGDSLSAGVGSSDVKSTFPYQYALHLSHTSGGAVTLINLATPGATTQDLITRELAPALASKPQVVTLLIGINDIHNFTSVSTFRILFKSALNRLTQNPHTKVVVLTIPYLGSSQSVSFPYSLLLDFRTRQYNQTIKEVAKSFPVTLIDLYSQSRPLSQLTPGFYSPDLFHPSARGYMIWSQIIDAS